MSVGTFIGNQIGTGPSSDASGIVEGCFNFGQKDIIGVFGADGKNRMLAPLNRSYLEVTATDLGSCPTPALGGGLSKFQIYSWDAGFFNSDLLHLAVSQDVSSFLIDGADALTSNLRSQFFSGTAPFVGLEFQDIDGALRGVNSSPEYGADEVPQ